MDECNKVPTPAPKDHLTTDMCPKTMDERALMAGKPYCAIVGKCMYLSTCTRPDISYAVRELARFMSNFGKRHMEAANHLLRYLKGTATRGIIYGNLNDTTPIFRSFTDSDWAMADDRRSISGYIMECSSAPISWSSKQQSIVALSSCEAEYLFCTHAAHHVIWLQSLFSELGFPQTEPSELCCDNQGTVTCTHDPHSHSCMKHIDIRAHFIRDSVNRQIMRVNHIPRVENPADLLTKPLEKVIHAKWLQWIRLDTDQPSMENVC
jgi:hypothetical protein